VALLVYIKIVLALLKRVKPIVAVQLLELVSDVSMARGSKLAIMNAKVNHVILGLLTILLLVVANLLVPVLATA
jgi:hypothetical protein